MNFRVIFPKKIPGSKFNENQSVTHTDPELNI